jgi:hypothetical protein
MTNTQPSEWFAGLSAAYEEVRDFLMTPFQWIQLDLTPQIENMFVLSAILAGALARGFFKYPAEALWHLLLFGSIVALISLLFLLAIVSSDSIPSVGTPLLNVASLVTYALVALSVTSPLTLMVLRSFGAEELDLDNLSPFLLLNVAFITAWGTALLLLNWATS